MLKTLPDVYNIKGVGYNNAAEYTPVDVNTNSFKIIVMVQGLVIGSLSQPHIICFYIM